MSFTIPIRHSILTIDGILASLPPTREENKYQETRERIRKDYTIIPHEGDVKISYERAIENAKILLEDVTLTANDQGELSYVSNFNLIARVIHWVKNFRTNSETDRVSMAVRATFAAIHEHNQIKSRILESSPAIGWDSTNTKDGWYFPVEKNNQTLLFGFDDLHFRAYCNGHLQEVQKNPEDKKLLDQVCHWSAGQKQRHGLSIVDLFKLTLEQAQHNAQILHNPNDILTVDDQGNLGSISRFNLIGRFVHWIKSLIKGSEEFKMHKAVLATFQTFNQQGNTRFSELATAISRDKRIFTEGYTTPMALSHRGHLKESIVLKAIQDL